jgi:hypothetical protein
VKNLVLLDLSSNIYIFGTGLALSSALLYTTPMPLFTFYFLLWRTDPVPVIYGSGGSASGGGAGQGPRSGTGGAQSGGSAAVNS